MLIEYKIKFLFELFIKSKIYSRINQLICVGLSKLKRCNNISYYTFAVFALLVEN